ncbi:Isoleucine--tRNA ligase [Dissostichus eleginoides]|uniref:Isoleucine--tRNA ligase n=1 Tax=Dissostichus eleginoides TaxID=100907 RepID=A0AAD9F8W6_DISEL|nr:Isoleucine--tRNA ligase [Dissostichus eleginoides]
MLTETMSDIQKLREMVSEIQELGEMAVAANEIFLNYTRQEQVLLRCHRRIEQEYMEESKKEEKDEANSVNLETLSQSPDIGTIDRDTSDTANDSVPSSPPAIFEEEEKQEMSSDVATVADTSRLKEYSRNPFDPGFTTAGLGCEEERVRVDGTKEEEDVQTERQWKEWMDKQEMRGHTYKVKQVDQQNTEKPREAAHPQKEVMQNPKEVKAVKKMKTLFFDLMNPVKFHKWERFEDED